MSDTRKIIPIASTPPDARTEIGSCAEAEPYALRVVGDSMAPEFLDGQVVIVDPAATLQPGAYVIVDYAGETMFRQFAIEGEKKLLKAANSAYPAIELVGDYRLRGVVVQRAGRRRRDHKHYP